MHPSAGFPAALPVTTTAVTPPVEPNVTFAFDTGSSWFRQLRACGKAWLSALVTAPCDGFSGTLPGANCGPLGAAGAAGAAAPAPAAPTAFCTASPRLPAGAFAGAGAAGELVACAIIAESSETLEPPPAFSVAATFFAPGPDTRRAPAGPATAFG